MSLTQERLERDKQQLAREFGKLGTLVSSMLPETNAHKQRALASLREAQGIAARGLEFEAFKYSSAGLGDGR